MRFAQAFGLKRGLKQLSNCTLYLLRVKNTYLTLTFEDDKPLTQCAAVKTHEGSISEPPQNCLLELVINIACHGQLFMGASVPPTMRTLGRDPQEPDKTMILFITIHSYKRISVCKICSIIISDNISDGKDILQNICSEY